MCGICGVYNYKQSDIRPVLSQMLKAMEHRGPDEEGQKIYEQERAALGHKRLSIIDLGTGQQPMFNSDGSIGIVFNGEIYNYREIRSKLEGRFKFRTNSDTESLLYLYESAGPDMLQQLNGMFAFAIWDDRKKSLLIARDRIGIKPLYYTIIDDQFVFASEIKPLLDHPNYQKKLRVDSVYKYLHLRCVPTPYTMFEGIYKLEPGHYLQVDRHQDRLRVKKEMFWSLTQLVEQGYIHSEAELFGELDTVLNDSVRLRMVSDVPIGAFLSGGIDSSLIVELMSDISTQPVNTYTLGFENDPRSELRYAKIAAEHSKANHREIVLSQESFLERVPMLISSFDDPVADGAALPIYLMAQAAKSERNIKVLLSGEGSDELFGGYSSYLSYLTIHRLISTFSFLPLQQLIPFLMKMNIKRGLLYKIYGILQHGALYSGHASNQIENAAALFAPNYRSQIDFEYFSGVFQQYDHLNMSFIEKMMLIDMQYRMPDDLLTRLDRMTMAASVEGRVPFLDHRFVELSYRARPNYKIRGKIGKYIIKKIAEKYIPHEIIYRKKSGFPVPINMWLKSEKQEMYRSEILENLAGIFSAEGLEQVLDSHYGDRANNTTLIWRLFYFSRWYQHWFA